MMFSVPQFIDIEDKIAGPLTWRQLLWMIGMGAVLLIMFNTLDIQLFIILAIPMTLLFVALAWYRPNGIPLPVFIFHAFLFLFRPKVAVWERPIRQSPAISKATPKKSESSEKLDKHLTQEKLKELAKIVDSR